MTASVASPPSEVGQPGGTVAFTVDGKPGGTAQLKDGVATWTTTALKDGTRQIVAAYAGDAQHAASKSTPFTERIDLAPPTKGGSGTATAQPPTTPPLPSRVTTHGGGVLASTGAKVELLVGGSAALLSVGPALTVLGRRRPGWRHRA